VDPYYQDDTVTLYHGDCREHTQWLAADVLVTDPPYGRAWRQGRLSAKGRADDSHQGIAGDADATARDAVLAMWGDRPAIVFGDLMLPPPDGTKLVAIYRKPLDAGMRGSIGGFRRDAEAIYLIGKWRSSIGGTTSVIGTAAPLVGSPVGLAGKTGHPHTKPQDVMETLLAHCPAGAAIADPFAGSGSTLLACRNTGRRAIGVELEERYCEVIAKRLAQDVLDFGPAA
jgi:hypothetical protein